MSWSQGVHGAADPFAPAIQYVGIDHGRLHVFGTEELLNGPDVIPVLQEMRRERMAEGGAGGMLGEPRRGGCGLNDSLEDRRIGVMAKTGWRRGRTKSGGRIGLPARLGSGALSLADPMEPPPSVVTGRGNGPEVTPDRFGLSSPTATWQAWDEGAGQGRYAVAPWAPGGGDLTGATAATDSPAESTRPARLYLAGGSSEVTLGWNKFDRGLLGQIIGPNGGLLLN